MNASKQNKELAQTCNADNFFYEANNLEKLAIEALNS
jgi:hypothetical protein